MRTPHRHTDGPRDAWNDYTSNAKETKKMIPIDRLNTAYKAAKRLQKIFDRGCGSELCVVDRNFAWAGKAACDCVDIVTDLTSQIDRAIMEPGA